MDIPHDDHLAGIAKAISEEIERQHDPANAYVVHADDEEVKVDGTFDLLRIAKAVDEYRSQIITDLQAENARLVKQSIMPGLDHIANFINALDSEAMSGKEVRTAIYSECLQPSKALGAKA